ncbi:ribosomal L1 domain-containing protein 1 [Brachyhypopomus gauderio]|uniref:ribosomal L1 domain-containing protein 1 n=1 Tax=Brachyhypopomus gauderio TaxID=698409 RepID=UPI004041B3CD
MRLEVFLHTCTMEPSVADCALDLYQVKKSVQALQAFLKSTSSQNSLLTESQQISLLLTLWKIPKQDQNIRIPLPHPFRNESVEVCLFTRDEPKMTSDQTERFYKKLLTQRGVKHVTEVIPFKVLKTEYKPFEAKRKLLSNFDIFLSDARIRGHLSSHIGRHFYERKKAPLSVDMESKHLARDMDRLIQGTTLKVTKKGACCMVHIANSGMTADEIVENINTAFTTISSKLYMKGKNIKIIHLKSRTSVALPVYSSDLSHLTLLEEELKKTKLAKGTKRAKNKITEKQAEEEDDEEIPQLVPIESRRKKPKLEVPSTKGPKKTSKPTVNRMGQKGKRGQRKLGKKAPKAQTPKAQTLRKRKGFSA